jgi:hypothetical protein
MSGLIALITPLFLGIVFIIIGMTLLAKRKKIIQNGIEVEGTIFDFEASDFSRKQLY